MEEDKKAATPNPPAPSDAAPSGTVAKPTTVQAEEDFPDPDEDFPDDDDLDDLDDELDQFIAPAPGPAAAPNAPPVPAPPETAKGKIPDLGATLQDTMSDFDFAKDLSEDMRTFMKEIEGSSEMKAGLEEVFAAVQAAAGATEGAAEGSAEEAPRPTTSSSATGPKASFKDTIAGLTSQLNSSDKATKEDLASGVGVSEEEAMLSQLLKNIPMGALGGEGGGSEDDFTNMLMGMMEQLTTKEILYDPMKELQQSFPAWLEKNKEKPPEETKDYREQYRLVNEIVAKFEESGYSDSDPERKKYIVDRMQAMQATGSVPPELLGDSPSMQEAFSGNDCNPQ